MSIKGIELMIADDNWDHIFKQLHDLSGWPVWLDDEDDDPNGPKAFWLGAEVTGIKGAKRNIGIRISQDALIEMLHQIKTRFSEEESLYTLSEKSMVSGNTFDGGCDCEECACNKTPLKDRGLESLSE